MTDGQRAGIGLLGLKGGKDGVIGGPEDGGGVRGGGGDLDEGSVQGWRRLEGWRGTDGEVERNGWRETSKKFLKPRHRNSCVCVCVGSGIFYSYWES